LAQHADWGQCRKSTEGVGPSKLLTSLERARTFIGVGIKRLLLRIDAECVRKSSERFHWCI
jgi:hypothetical protein